MQLDFETELNIGPYMSNRRAGPQMYELYGVLVHAGHSVHSGHYYCFVRGPNGIWHHMDDTRVSQVCMHGLCLWTVFTAWLEDLAEATKPSSQLILMVQALSAGLWWLPPCVKLRSSGLS